MMGYMIDFSKPNDVYHIERNNLSHVWVNAIIGPNDLTADEKVVMIGLYDYLDGKVGPTDEIFADSLGMRRNVFKMTINLLMQRGAISRIYWGTDESGEDYYLYKTGRYFAEVFL